MILNHKTLSRFLSINSITISALEADQQQYGKQGEYVSDFADTFSIEYIDAKKTHRELLKSLTQRVA
jgi:hypothetical protein